MQLNDNPVVFSQDDTLDREPLAKIIADEIQNLDVSQGSVVAITGPWGSGKTSLVNLVKDHLGTKVTSFDFNPWLFSGASDLLSQFFSEFSLALEPEAGRLGKVASALEEYGHSLKTLKAVPFVGGYVDVAATVMEGTGRVLGSEPKSLVEQKRKLEKVLQKQDRIFLVFVDDLDRLDSDEVRQIMKLVRLVGNLPKVVYVLAYDQERIEAALGNGGLSGREYLEKVVFSSYEMPRVNKSQIRTILIEGLNDVLQSFDISLTNDLARHDEVMHRVLLPNIATLRNAKRFLVSCRAVCRELHTDVDVLDVLCLEALRLFKPAVYRKLAEHSYAIAWTANDHTLFNQQRIDLSKSAIDEILSVDPSDSVVWILKNLFPFAWRHYDEKFFPDSNVVKFLHDRRIGNRDVFTKYLDRFDEPGVIAARRLNELLSQVADRHAIDEYWRSLHLNEAADLAELLAETTQQISDEMVILLALPLIHLSAERPVNPRRFADNGVPEPARFFLARQLARRSKAERLSVAWDIYAQMENFEARYRLIQNLEMEDTGGQPLLGTDSLDEFVRRFAREFSEADSDALARERWLLYLSTQLVERGEEFANSLPDFLATPKLAWAFLRSASSEAMPDRHGNRRLQFDVLAADRVLGGRKRVQELIALCEVHPTSNQSDEEMLRAAQGAIGQLNGAIFGGDLEAQK